MKALEAKALAKQAGQLFNELKTEQLKLIAERLVPFELKCAVPALKNHRVAHEFFTWPAFMEGLRAERDRRREGAQRRENETVLHWLRQQTQKFGEDGLALLTVHFSAAWAAVANDAKADDPGKQMIRRLIHGHAFTAFRQIGWSPEEAREVADECVGLQPGEKIPQLSFFKALPEPATPAAMIEQLAAPDLSEPQTPDPGPSQS